MARKTSKICLVCGKAFDGTAAKMTCSSACRTAMSRMVAENKKPEFWLIAKGKGQKIPTFKKTEKKEPEKPLNSAIQFQEPNKDSFNGERSRMVGMDEQGQWETPDPLTKEQINSKIVKLELEITAIEKAPCPLNQHPKSFKLTQEVKASDLKDKVKYLRELNPQNLNQIH